MKLFASIVQDYTSPDEREDGRSPCAVSSHPVLRPICEALR